MFVFVNYESAVINNMAKVALFISTVSKSMDHISMCHEPQHGLWWQSINMASGGSVGHSQCDFTSSTAYRHQHDFRLQHRPQTFIWLSVVTWVMDSDTNPSCRRTVDPDMALSGSMGHRHQHDLR